jgi:pimeloyl-ACP methyl ester carboxylesterase
MQKGRVGILTLVMLAVVISGCSLMEKRITSRIDYDEPVQRPYAMETKTIMVDDVNIAYMEAGSGPTVVLIHGGVIPIGMVKSWFAEPLLDTASVAIGYVPLLKSVMHAGAVSTSNTWNYNIKPLSKNYHVVAIDLPGFGASDKPEINYDMDDFVSYLDGFLKAKGIENPTLIGHGFGGMICIAYAAEHKDNIDRMVLVDSFGGYEARGFRSSRSTLNLPKRIKGVPFLELWQREKAAKVSIFAPKVRRIFGNWDVLPKRMIEVSIAQGSKYDHPDDYRDLIVSWNDDSEEFIKGISEFKDAYFTTEEMSKESHAIYKTLMECRRKNLGQHFTDIDVPVLLINGFYDPIVRFEETQYMALSFPKARAIIFEKSSHYPMVEEADRFNEEVTFFLSADKNLAASVTR